MFNGVDSFLVHQDPLYVLGVLGTFFLGQEAPTTAGLAFLLLAPLAHVLVGAIVGALFHCGVNLMWPHLASLGVVLLVSSRFGILLWITSFCGGISWLPPQFVGEDSFYS